MRLAVAALLSACSLGGAAAFFASAREEADDGLGLLASPPPEFVGLDEPEPETGFHTVIMALPRRASVVDFESALFVPNALGQLDYGLAFASAPQTPFEARSGLQIRPVGELTCRNALVLHNRAAYIDYLDRMACYEAQDGDGACAFPDLAVATGYSDPDCEGNWSYDVQLDRVVNADGSEGPACRTDIQEKNRRIAGNSTAWETGFDSMPMNLRSQPVALRVEFSLPHARAAQDYGIDFVKTPTTALLAKARLHVLPVAQLPCPNEFAGRNQQAYIAYVNAMAECEQLGDFCYPNIPALQGLASPLDARLDGVVHPNGSRAQPCQAGLQRDNREALANFTLAADEHARNQQRVKADKLRLSREHEQAARDATTGGYVTLALGSIGLVGTAAALRRSLCAQPVQPTMDAQDGSPGPSDDLEAMAASV